MNPLDMMITELNAENMGLPLLSLMENAGNCLAQEIKKISDSSNISTPLVQVFVGMGGNGGDGLVATRHLLNQGFQVEILLVDRPRHFSCEESKSNWQVINNIVDYNSSLKLKIINDSQYLEKVRIDQDKSVLVDSLLGTGIKGKLREPVRSIIKFINNSPGIKIAVDVPSGLNPLNGKIEDIAVKADYTITFHRAKTGLKLNQVYSGEIRVCDIGIPEQVEQMVGAGELLRIKKRDPYAHKGAHGQVLVIGGSKEYSGAPALAALSALKSGADLVHVICPEVAALPIKSYSPDLIVRGLKGDFINTEMVDNIFEMASKVDCVLLGCGAGQHKTTKEAFNLIVQKINKPLIMDADALKLVKKDQVKDKEDLIITPHSAEFNAFFHKKIYIPLKMEEKIRILNSIIPEIKGVVLLKGTFDLIFQQEKFRFNKTGSPGMTVGGTGDCLAGLVSSLVAQGHSPFDSACLGAFINGRAGELAEKRLGYNFTASEMIWFIDEAMKI